MMRAAIIVLALVLAVASAGMALCEMDCASSGHSDASAAASDSANNIDVMHCHGQDYELPPLHTSLPHGSSHGNANHNGAHVHPRIVATTTAKISVAPFITISAAAIATVTSFDFAADTNVLWINSSPPPINSPSAFATGVLRI